MQAYFPMQGEQQGVGALNSTPETIKKLALESQNYVCKNCGDIK